MGSLKREVGGRAAWLQKNSALLRGSSPRNLAKACAGADLPWSAVRDNVPRLFELSGELHVTPPNGERAAVTGLG